MLDTLIIRIFLSNKLIKIDKWGKKSIELVEVDLELVMVHLESSLMRNHLGFTGFFGWFEGFQAILKVKMGTKVDVFWLESIELVELDLKPVLESFGVVHRRIGPGFSVIFGCFGWFLAILGVKMGTEVDFFDWNR